MNETIRDQYDSLYASEKNVFGGGKPIEAVCKLRDYLSKGRVLDIGGGEGRNALYLAKQGFSVSVLDISKVAMDGLKETAEKNDLNIDTRVVDVTKEDIDGTYNSIVVTFVLHHLDDVEARDLITKAQHHTVNDGVHIVSTFTNQGDLYNRNKTSGRFYPSEEIIRELYADWNIKELSTKEVTTHARHKDAARMKNHVLTLIAIINK